VTNLALWPNGLTTPPDTSSTWLSYPRHYGCDFKNFDVNRAVMGGDVVTAGWSYLGGGYIVEVLADIGDLHRYLHNAIGLFVTVGERVEAGEPLAYQGTTGLSTGKHLHFAVRIGGRAGKYVDPFAYLAALVATTSLALENLELIPDPAHETEDSMHNQPRQIHWKDDAGKLQHALLVPGTGYWVPWTEGGSTYANEIAAKFETGLSALVTASLAANFKDAALAAQINPPAR